MDKALVALRARLIDDARQFWRFWSIRLQAIGLGLIGLAEPLLSVVDPLSQALNLVPPDVRALVPGVRYVGAFLIVAGMIARVVKQKSPGQ